MGPLDLAPPTRLSGFNGPQDTVHEMIRAVLGDRGERSMLVRSVTENVVQQVQPKDYLSELIAIRNFVATKVRYANDALAVEIVKDPQRLIEEILQRGVAVGNCDDIASLIVCMARQVGRSAEFVTVGFGPAGNYSHVFARAKEPKSGRWIVLDPVAGTDERKMLRRVTTWRAWKLD